MRRAAEIQRITRVFPGFLGLRLLPIGAWFLIVGAAAPLVGPVSTPAQATLLVIALLTIWPVHGWYRRQYGSVEPERLALGRNWMILAGLAMATGTIALGARVFGSVSAQVLLIVVVFFIVAVLFAMPRVFSASRTEQAIIGTIGLLGTVLVLRVGSDSSSFNHLGSLFSVLVGITLGAAGLVEHRSLSRTLDGSRASNGD